MKQSNAERTAKVIRKLSDPPYMGALFALVLSAVRSDLFTGAGQKFLLLLFLGLLPAPGYILRPTGSTFRRLLPFLITLASYAGALLWAHFANTSPALMLVCRTYFFSVLLLTCTNLLAHSNASGHVCSVVGPLVLLMYLTGAQLLWIGIPLICIIVWASVFLNIHQWSDILLGCLVFGAAFTIALSLGTP